jgi:dienelactone hydrolase
MRSIILLGLAVLQFACANADKPVTLKPIETSEIHYKANGKDMVGYVARPKNLSGKAPAVLVVHEWWGQTEYPRKRAEMLAEQGYVAMAVDMFGQRAIADHPKTAGQFAGSVMKNAKEVATRFNAALKAVRARPDVDTAKVAAVGYCFGGSVVVEMAKQGADLAVVASFHGGLATPTKPKAGKIKAKVAVFNGGADMMVTPDQVKEFQDGMKQAKADLVFVSYPGAKHGFTNPQASMNGEKFGLPLAYDPEADQKSWTQLTEILNKSLR